MAAMSSRPRRRKCSGYGSAATAARVIDAFAIQTPECMRAFPSERTFNRCQHRWATAAAAKSLLDGSRGGRTRRRGSPQGLSNRSYRVGAQARCPAPSDDIRAMSAFASHSGYVVRGPKMPIHWSPPKASPVGFGSCEQVAGGGPERRVPHFHSCAAGGIALIGRRPVALCLAC